MKKLYTPAMSFVCVMGALAVMFYSCADITSVVLMLIAYLPAVTLGFYAHRQLRPLKILKTAVACWSLFSCAVSVTVSARLLQSSAVITDNSYPFVLVLTATFAAILATSPDAPIKSTTLVCTLFCVSIILVTLILSLLDTDFAMPRAIPPKLSPALPLAFFSITDVFLLFCFSRHKTPAPYLAGGALAFLCMLAIILACICVLSAQIYYSLDAPLLKLWQSTYITSFVNRFEVIAVTALYLITAIKSGLVLRPCFKKTDKKLHPLLIIPVILACIPLSFL